MARYGLDRRNAYSTSLSILLTGIIPACVWGLYDMHGNVGDYCNDWRGDNTGDATDPTGPHWAHAEFDEEVFSQRDSNLPTALATASHRW